MELPEVRTLLAAPIEGNALFIRNGSPESNLEYTIAGVPVQEHNRSAFPTIVATAVFLCIGMLAFSDCYGRDGRPRDEDSTLLTTCQGQKTSRGAKGTNKAANGKSRSVVAVWEISSFGKRTDRFVFYSDGKTDKDQKWSVDGKKFSFGFDSGGNLTPGGMLAVGKWQRGGVFTARLLMKAAELKTVPADKFNLAKSHGASAYGKMPSGSLDETAVDAWELTATTRRAKKLIRLSLDFTSDHQVLDGARRIGTWSIEKRRTVVKFEDDQFGKVSFGLRNRNEFFARIKSKDGERWDCTLRRIQTLAVFKTDTRGTLTLYSNGRVNSPRAENGKGYFWTLKPDATRRMKLAFDGFSSTVSPDGRSFSGRGPYGARVKGALVSGSLRGMRRK